MEDKKVLDFINENHEKSYKNFVEKQKRKILKENIIIGLLIIILLALFVWLTNIVYEDTQKAIANCMNKGYEYDYCVIAVQ